MPSITETMRSTVPEATGKKDLRAEKTSTPAPESQNVEADTASGAPVDQVELSESVARAIEDAKFDADLNESPPFGTYTVKLRGGTVTEGKLHVKWLATFWEH